VSCSRFGKPKQEIPSNNEQEMAQLHYMIQQPIRHIQNCDIEPFSMGFLAGQDGDGMM